MCCAAVQIVDLGNGDPLSGFIVSRVLRVQLLLHMALHVLVLNEKGRASRSPI